MRVVLGLDELPAALPPLHRLVAHVNVRPKLVCSRSIQLSVIGLNQPVRAKTARIGLFLTIGGCLPTLNKR